MAIWNRNTVKRPTEDAEDEDEMKTFEEIVEDRLDDLMSLIKKFDKRIEIIEKEQETRICSLERDLRKKGEYIEMLLSKLLDQHVAVPMAQASAARVPVKPSTPPPVNGQNREKLAGPKPGAKLGGDSPATQ